MLEHPLLTLPDNEKQLKSLNKGEYLFHQFDAARFVYFLHSGAIQLQRNAQNGHRIIVHNARAGESFAEASLFSENYHCDAICVSDARLVQISKSTVLKRMKSDPDFSIKLTKMLSRQVQRYRQQIEIITIKSAEEKLLAALAGDVPYEQITELASSIGLTHEASYRALSRLVKRGVVIKLARGKYALNQSQFKAL